MPAKKQPNFPPSFYGNFQVKKLSPAQIDDLLANGWFRNSNHVFASSIKFMGDSWRSCVMLRVSLEHFTWKKRLRKLLRKNGASFRVEIRPFRQTEEKEVLWQKFKSEIHNWMLIPKLEQHLLKSEPAENFNTWELCVYDNEKLIAFSIFDRGGRSIASLEAAYDSEYQRFSLGVYTMMLEIEFAKEQGMGFYYPGFYPHAVPMFDYKLRPGHLEFFRLKEKRWLPLAELNDQDWLRPQLLARYDEAKILLRKYGFIIKTGFGLYESKPSQKCLATDYNILLVATKADLSFENPTCLIAWDPVEEAYMLFASMPVLGQAYWEPELSQEIVRLLDIRLSKFYGKIENVEDLPAAVLHVTR